MMKTESVSGKGLKCSINKINVKWDIIIIYIICTLPRVILSFGMLPLANGSDEVSSISVAAMLAGYDWRGVISQAGYYGFGYTFIFWPLFRLKCDPVWIARVVFLCSSLIEGFCSVVCYKTLSILEPTLPRAKKNIISILCGYATLYSTMYMHNTNEEPLVLCYWIIFYLVVKIICSDNGKGTVRNEIVLLFLLAYSLTLHTRAVMVYIALFIFSAVYFAARRKLPFHIFFYFALVVAYVFTRFLISKYQASIWEGNGSIRNASVIENVGGFISLLKDNGLDRHLIASVLRIICAQIYTTCVFSGGLFPLAAVAFLYNCFRAIKANSESEQILFLIGLFALACIICSSAGQAIMWSPGIYVGWSDSFRSFAYTRYFGTYVSPFLMCGLLAYDKYQSHKDNKATIIISVFVSAIIVIIWRWFVFPSFDEKSLYRHEIMLMAMSLSTRRRTLQMSNWITASMLFLECNALISTLLSKKKNMMCCCFLVGLLIFSRFYGYYTFTLIFEESAYSKSNAGYELLQKLESVAPQSTIYVYDASDATANQVFYYYQYYNYDKEVITTIPEDLGTHLLFVNSDIRRKLPECWCLQLDNNEYVYGQDYRTYQIIEELGYNPIYGKD